MKNLTSMFLLLVLISCGSSTWSDADRTSYIASCTEDGTSEAICSCAADELAKDYDTLAALNTAAADTSSATTVLANVLEAATTCASAD